MSPLSIKLFKRQILTAILILGLGFLSNVTVAQQKSDPQFEKMMKDSFRAQGIAGLDRIDQDATQKFCSDPLYVASLAGAKKAIEIQKLNMSEIAQPSDGKYIGDWKSGEAIAQSGRGATWSDSATTPIGGGCYNCHQIDQKEISYGNIGPSLWNYGKNRGYSQEIITYTWNRINNSKAYNACSNMPRFAHFKLLNEKQIQDLMALLLDPQSPVNQ
ncbi:sulfur oxidation c-type cytochrome SoxX [Polynucleobacter paneuropaeus]|uniref:Sulfur oxidation c-type cytochrome SoxX n=1 Tax=Polynucleobacter paneuropaeus TaxID=2527775 RepID=A0A9Q2WI10_9BURK|nr:sulfur oxidation c-type cytochrome SoxX [Polynucleobacter paneuropaeus]MBT8531373.1 sulfur oxidation c-type cytochrome SoxX [Polynucleobacter paneuropaeus]MBT8550756.1 sulfur oxidation c-type cytochrome SoxX [Polynucleobacter paneuropaeus]MBT8602070.1 sulfur oxidation c-type cytochrome SoxX [Polynucleobacter paneuropaeus]MBT8624022.1 sulfur oxidation c-type cytochrome SoxX [Polynucleobacter paneuropaeus]